MHQALLTDSKLKMAPGLRKAEQIEVVYDAVWLLYSVGVLGQIHANQGNAHLRAVDCIA